MKQQQIVKRTTRCAQEALDLNAPPPGTHCPTEPPGQRTHIWS